MVKRIRILAFAAVALIATSAFADVGDSATAAGDLRSHTTIEGRSAAPTDTPPSLVTPKSVEQGAVMNHMDSGDAHIVGEHAKACASDPGQPGCPSTVFSPSPSAK